MSGSFVFTTSLEGYGPEALEALEVILNGVLDIQGSPSDALIDEFEDRVDLAANCYEIFDLAINEMTVLRKFPERPK